ncbi:MAG: glycosyltransferase family 4 protein [Chlamydiia bacterium]
MLSGFIPFCYFFLTLSISIIGTIDKRDGIGRQSLELGHALKKHYPIHVVPIGEYGELDPEDMALLYLDYRYLNQVVLVNTSLPEIPYIVESLKKYRREGQIFVCYTMVESDFVDPYFIEVLKFFDHLIVPDPFLVDVFQKSGLTLPITVIPLAVDLSPFLEASIKKWARNPFIFGNYSACIPRKDQLLLVKAFEKKFSGKPEVKLRINARGGDPVCIQTIKNYLKGRNLSNVEFAIESKSAPEYLNLFRETDCYVSPSWGEGFSIQPRQAMAMGLPVIVSPNSGQKTIADSGLAYALKKEYLVDASYTQGFGFFDMGQMWASDVDELADLMEEAHRHYHASMKNNKLRRQWAAQYDFEKGTFVEEFCQFFNELK